MIYLIFFIGHHVVLTGAILAALAAIGAFFLFRQRKALPALALIGAAFVLFALNGFLGAGFANGLVYAHGVQGHGKTVGDIDTYARLNRNSSAKIQRYTVLITAPDGRVVRTWFESYTRVLYPRFDDATTDADYPSHIGDQFNVRYLPGHPHAFVIVTNDNSAWAGAHACKTVSGNLHRIKSHYDPDPTNPDFPPQYIAAINAYLASGCTTDPDEIASLRQMLATLQGAGHR